MKKIAGNIHDAKCTACALKLSGVPDKELPKHTCGKTNSSTGYIPDKKLKGL